jgi:hypothetical protein
MKDYSEFPPIKYFIRVLKNGPKAALLYVLLWRNKNRRNHIMIRKNAIRKEYLISPTMFRNLVASLMFLNLISFVESNEQFEIEIMGPQENE